jgi:hypothetical protein
MSNEEEQDQGFRVTDKRLFSEDGQPRENAAERPQVHREPANAPASQQSGTPAAGPPPETGARIDFPSYILSYYTQGLVLLGEVPNPYTNKKEEDLEAARHTVDILGMLQEKTKGNLSPEEGQLLESVLYEVRMKYMARVKQIKLT